MSERRSPNIYNIAAHGGFADALAQGLVDRFAKDETGLARGLLILPNNRARNAIQEAFVRLSENGLLLPQMAVIGDLELDESIGIALEGGKLALDIPAAVAPLDRLLQLARMIADERQAHGDKLLAKDALTLAEQFARTFDQLTIEEITMAQLRKTEPESQELSQHWQKSYQFFLTIAGKWQQQLRQWELIDEASRRNMLFNHIAKSWKMTPPDHFVVAAGITTAAPAVARLLQTISFMPNGLVVLPGVDLIMADDEWQQLGPFQSDEPAISPPPAQETHPQFHLKLLLARMSIARAEILRWPRTAASGAAASRSRALSHAFAIPKLTGRWQTLTAKERNLAGVRTLEVRNSAEEAQSVALLVREALETPLRRVAIITPERVLAGRISAHLKRWNINVDDTAGQPLAKTPPGIFLLNLLTAVADGFPPAETLALLKHPLFAAGEGRLAWLEQVRNLDMLLRGPRPAPGLAGIDNLLAMDDYRLERIRIQLRPWWRQLRQQFEPITMLLQGQFTWADLLAAIRETANQLTNEQLWSGPAGRELARIFSELEIRHDLGPQAIMASELPGYFEIFLNNISVRPVYGGHPRVALYGLLEARLQQADLVICCGLNEGSWPQAITPDPWLAPMIRKLLRLPAQERQIGLSAHDLVGAMGANEVILTRAQRNERGPAIASRFLLRLQAMSGNALPEYSQVSEWARLIDHPPEIKPVDRPAPMPNAAQRHIAMSVTQVDRLIADPYAFYANKIMGLSSLDLIDAEPGAAWRGTIVHAMLDSWARLDDYDPAALQRRAMDFLNDRSSHPLMRSLWAPRLIEGLLWIAQTIGENRKSGRLPAATEISGKAEIAGVMLTGVADRIDYMADGSLAIIDYKTGRPPSNRAVQEGFNLQLGLLGAIAELDGFKNISGQVTSFEYWSLAKDQNSGTFGYVRSPVKGRGDQSLSSDAMVDHAIAHFNQAVDQYIFGDQPMAAKLHPEYARYADYDQLMRVEEWYGRTGVKAVGDE